MPRLDLLPEDGYQVGAVFLEQRVAEGRRVDGFEELGAERADVVEVWSAVLEGALFLSVGLHWGWEMGSAKER